MSLHQVSLGFQAYIQSDDNRWVKIGDPVYSNNVNNSETAAFCELVIDKISATAGPASGEQEILMFVEKVDKSENQITNHEMFWRISISF